MLTGVAPYNFSPTLFSGLMPQPASTGIFSAGDMTSLLDASQQAQYPAPGSTTSLPTLAGLQASAAQQLLGDTFGVSIPAGLGVQPIPGFPIAANPYDPSYYQNQVTGTLLNAMV